MNKHNTKYKPQKNKTHEDLKAADTQDVSAELSPPPARRRKVALFQLGLLALAVAFAALAFFARQTAFFSWDLQITKFLQTVNSTPLTYLMKIVSWVGYWPQSTLAALVIALLLYLLRLRWEAVASVVCAISNELLNLLVKTVIHRPRPPVSLVHVAKALTSASFPSGHVEFYTGYFGFICFLIFTQMKPSWKRTLLLAIFGGHVALVGLSRVYLGEHWASDALGAYLLGSLSLIGFVYFYRWGKSRFLQPQGSKAKTKK